MSNKYSIKFSILVSLSALSLVACGNQVAKNSQTDTIASTPQTTQQRQAITTIPNVQSQISDTLKNNTLTVHRDPNCGCCHSWIEHAKSYGVMIVDKVTSNEAVTAIKAQHQLPTSMYSCHTIISQDGYVFEGHVPVKYMDKFLQNPPKDAIGLATPGMPMGSPGMEMGDQFSPYTIMLIKKDGSTAPYASIKQANEQY